MIFSIYKINGKSMEPNFHDSDYVLAFGYIFSKPNVNDVVIARKHSRGFIIKRIKKIKNDKYFLIGDNEKFSTDSRKFGFISRKNIIGRVILKIGR